MVKSTLDPGMLENAFALISHYTVDFVLKNGTICVCEALFFCLWVIPGTLIDPQSP